MAASGVKIDEGSFARRLKTLYTSWKVGSGPHRGAQHGIALVHPGVGFEGGTGIGLAPKLALLTNLCLLPTQDNAELWGNVSSFAVAAGTTSEELRYLKSLALQQWLFGYELPGELVCAKSRGGRAPRAAPGAPYSRKDGAGCGCARIAPHTQPIAPHSFAMQTR